MPSSPVTHLSAVSGPGAFRCREVKDQGESSVRLKRFGICEGREIEVVQAGNPMVLRVCGTCVGMSRELSELVVVEESAHECVSSVSEGVSAGDC